MAKSSRIALNLCFFPLLLGLAIPALSDASVIYGKDTRVEASDLKDAGLKRLAQSVPALIDLDDVADEPAGVVQSVAQRFGFCGDERFSAESSFASCSGVLISPNEVLTASHCVLSRDACAKTKIVFGYTGSLSRGSVGLASFAPEDVYGCRRIRTSENCSLGICDPDLAIVELDRAVRGRAPVLVEQASRASEAAAALISMGYTLGTPLKLDLEGKVLNDSGAPTFSAALDIGPGNSGGPVFDSATGRLVGLAVAGPAEPFSIHPGKYDEKNACFRPIRCSDSGCADDGDVQIQRVDADVLARLGSSATR